MMRILVAYDGFEESRPALEEAARMALQEGAGRHGVVGPAEIVVVSVVPPPAMTPSPGGPTSMPPHAIDDVALGHAFLRERGLESEMLILHGDPADEIVREATARRCDVIVCGTRGLGQLGRMFLGSVSRKLTKNAPCSVVVASREKTERYEPGALAKT
jgi:nucleotide-binding universal stress UspA family protein